MIFEVRNGSFAYKGGPRILHNISFSINKGEILSVLGPNGVGKTTLIKCMLGFQKWTSGCSMIDGKDIYTMPVKEMWRRVAYVPQAKSMIFSFSGLEMAIFGRSAYLGEFEQPREKDIEIAEDALETLGIWNLRDKLCGQMSGGELQMILMARALSTQPKLMVLDEPESGLDFKNQLVILELIQKLVQEKGLSVILNTHYPSNALRISNRTLMMTKQGESFYGPTRDIINENNMRTAFGVEVFINEVEIRGNHYWDVLPVTLASSYD